MILLFTVSACNFRNDKVSPDSNAGTFSDPEGFISFASVREKVFAPHCIECHVAYKNYSSVANDIDKIVDSISKNRMPKNSSPLSEDLRQLLTQWIEAGLPQAPPNVGPLPELPTGLQANWDSLSENIFFPRCAVCHSPNGEAPWVDLSSRSGMAKTLIKHIDFKQPLKSKLILRLSDKDEPMPPLPPYSDLPQLTEDEINVVIEWIEAGLP